MWPAAQKSQYPACGGHCHSAPAGLSPDARNGLGSGLSLFQWWQRSRSIQKRPVWATRTPQWATTLRLHLCLQPTCGPWGSSPPGRAGHREGSVPRHTHLYPAGSKPGRAPLGLRPLPVPTDHRRVQAPRLASEAQQGLRPGQPHARPHPDTGSTTLTISHGGRRGVRSMGLGNRHWFKSQPCHFAVDGRKKTENQKACASQDWPPPLKPHFPSVC